MNQTLEHRSAFADLEIRSDGRTVVGLAVPFSTPTEIRSGGYAFTESFSRGSFTRTIAESGSRVKVLALHDDRAMPLGRAVVLREDHRGLVAELRLSKTAAADEALQLINDGALDSLSIGFSAVRDQWSPDRRSVDRLEVKLHEISVVAFPAYEGARILAVRTEQNDITGDRDPAAWLDRLGLTAQKTPAEWRSRLGLHRL